MDGLSDFKDDLLLFHLKQDNLDKYKICFDFIKSRKMLDGHRKVLIDWLITVGVSLRVSDECLHLAVFLFDKYCSSLTQIEQSKIQAIGITCLWTASKFQEVTILDINECADLTDNSVEVDEMIAIEKDIFNKNEYQICVTSCVHFASILLKATKGDDKNTTYCMFLLNCCLLDTKLMAKPRFLVACAAVVLSHMCFQSSLYEEGEKFSWNFATFSWQQFPFSMEAIKECAKAITNSVNLLKLSKFDGVFVSHMKKTKKLSDASLPSDEEINKFLLVV